MYQFSQSSWRIHCQPLLHSPSQHLICYFCQAGSPGTCVWACDIAAQGRGQPFVSLSWDKSLRTSPGITSEAEEQWSRASTAPMSALCLTFTRVIYRDPALHPRPPTPGKCIWAAHLGGFLVTQSKNCTKQLGSSDCEKGSIALHWFFIEFHLVEMTTGKASECSGGCSVCGMTGPRARLCFGTQAQWSVGKQLQLPPALSQTSPQSGNFLLHPVQFLNPRLLYINISESRCIGHGLIVTNPIKVTRQCHGKPPQSQWEKKTEWSLRYLKTHTLSLYQKMNEGGATI